MVAAKHLEEVVLPALVGARWSPTGGGQAHARAFPHHGRLFVGRRFLSCSLTLRRRTSIGAEAADALFSDVAAGALGEHQVCPGSVVFLSCFLLG